MDVSGGGDNTIKRAVVALFIAKNVCHYAACLLNQYLLRRANPAAFSLPPNPSLELELTLSRLKMSRGGIVESSSNVHF